MRRTPSLRLLSVAACVVPALIPTGSAVAATTSVEGTGSFTKLVLANQQDAVVVKMYAPGGKGKVRWLNATVRDKDGVTYIAEGGWYGEKWIVDIGDGDAVVPCDDFSLTYNADGGFWKAVMPRTCLDGLANKVKVKHAEVNDGSPTPGEAGPTAYVARG